MPQWIDVPGDSSKWQLVEGSELAQLVESRNATVSGGVTGTGTATLAAATGTASGTTTVVGASARTLTGDTSNATGTTTVVGVAATSTAAATGAATGSTTIVGIASPTVGDDTATGIGNAGTPTPPDDGHSHSTGGRPLPRRRPQPPSPPRRPLALPGISGWADTTVQHATCAATGDVDPFNLLAEDEELLLLV